jgi:hypothetical protein
MNKITDKIGLRQFAARIFISNSSVSSRRVCGFISLVSLLFALFFKYGIEYIKVLALLVIGFFGLTTLSNIFQPKQNENNNTDNKG